MLHTLGSVTLALAIVLLLRKPGRLFFGASTACHLWWLLPMLALSPWLPPIPSSWITLPVQRVWPSTPQATAGILPEYGQRHVLLGLWLAGSAVLLLRLAWRYRQLQRDCRPLPAGMRQALIAHLPARDHAALAHARCRLHPAGPAVMWAPRSRLLLPADFMRRFDHIERRLVLQHELAHLRRHDPLWSLLAELTLALLWFHPLAWLALPRFRLDQELACDERVLRSSPADEADYARTLLHSTGIDPTLVLIPWLAEPQLKERLTMIQRSRHGALRRSMGFIALAALLAGSVMVAEAAQVTPTTAVANQDLELKQMIRPYYPEAAIKNKEQGSVMLKVLVDAKGYPRRIEVDPSATTAPPDLVKAATDVAAQWRFKPTIKHGKPIESSARVPVDFSLTESPAPAAQPASSNS